ncbi:hypothetical protein EYF80_002903 [Liparis tanakae]|uniref:Uncharacterized protein n=1 Tax=Liparis tanakae TaxID=230148 RepID=A0A4Z2J9D8_9TELE|nr:hypothetical protein EYF80_002903 [Liparis tanakae]
MAICASATAIGDSKSSTVRYHRSICHRFPILIIPYPYKCGNIRKDISRRHIQSYPHPHPTPPTHP